MADEDEWLDAEAAARYLSLPVRSIYRLIHDGRLEAVLSGASPPPRA